MSNCESCTFWRKSDKNLAGNREHGECRRHWHEGSLVWGEDWYREEAGTVLTFPQFGCIQHEPRNA